LDVCDGSGGCAGEVNNCGNGVLEPNEECDGGICCEDNCTFVNNGAICSDESGPFGCIVITCLQGKCAQYEENCPFGGTCCEFGCTEFGENCF